MSIDHRLQNPDGNFIKTALISEDENGRAWLSVETCYGRNSDAFRTLRGAKNAFARNFMVGAKWKNEN